MKLKNKFNIIIITICIISVFGMTIGYAKLSKLLDISGTATLSKGGKMEITRFELVGSSNFDTVNSTYSVNSDLTSVSFNLKFSKDDTISTNYYAVYEVDVENNSFFDYEFNAMNFNFNTVVGSAGGTGSMSTEVSGINNGDTIQKNSMITITIRFILNISDTSQNYDVSGSSSVDAEDKPINNNIFTIAVNTSSIDFRSNTNAKSVSYSVINTYDNDFSCTPRVNNNAFTVTNATTINVLAHEEGTTVYTANVTLNGNPKFYSDNVALKIILDCNNSLGSIPSTNAFNAYVNVYEEKDEQAPNISNVSVTKGNEGIVNVSWTGTDNSNGNITYSITLYDSSNTAIETKTVTNSTYSSQSTTFSVSQGTNSVTYYAKVKGTDSSNNTSSEIKSSNTTIKWRATITTSFSSVNSSNSATNVLIGSSYTTTLSYSGNSGSVTNSSVNVTMNGTTIINNGSVASGVSGVTYSSNTITINSVTGDISISASGSSDTCLAEGTQILLANGLTKNIEDIKYDDLLAVYNYDIGKIVYVYPLWIEEEHTNDEYQINYFSDGTSLTTVGSHGVFSKDNNKYVLVTDTENFHVGTRIVKFDEENKQKIVTVTKIEIIHEPVKYYHVSSTGYTNVIANGVLTSDILNVFSNLYEFDDNIVWTKDRNRFLKENDLFSDKELSKYFEEYIFLGFRANECKNIFNMGILDLQLYSDILKQLVKPTIKNELGNTIWKVTTSDNIYEGEYLEQESTYALPLPKNSNNFISWYNTSEDKYYMPGDTVRVLYGMHFEAIYE